MSHIATEEFCAIEFFDKVFVIENELFKGFKIISKEKEVSWGFKEVVNISINNSKPTQTPDLVNILFTNSEGENVLVEYFCKEFADMIYQIYLDKKNFSS